MTSHTQARPITILYAEDDEDDRLLTKDALRESRLLNDLHLVEDGEELLEFLRRTGRYQAPADAPRPDFIILDLQMPRKDGREALREIKADPALRSIPVIVLTTSKSEEDIYRSYDLGAASYITKPVTFQSLVQIVKALGQYWFEIVELPSKGGRRARDAA
ncbi:MAG TPA: response regulator [Planctomycetota bacterium]|nr:response regulator [Planctomycetota bacterium]